MTYTEGGREFELPGLVRQELPGGITIFAKEADLPFVARITTLGNISTRVSSQNEIGLESKVALPEHGPLFNIESPGDGTGGRV